MTKTASDRPCLGNCGRSATRGKPLCPSCAGEARRQRWREANPTFKEMVEMDLEKFLEAMARLRVPREEFAAGKVAGS